VWFSPLLKAFGVRCQREKSSASLVSREDQCDIVRIVVHMYWSTQYQLSRDTAAVFEAQKAARPEGRRSLHRRHTQHQARPRPIPQRSASADQRPLTSDPDHQSSGNSKPKKRLSFRKNLTRVAKNFNSGLSSLASSLSSLPSSTDEDPNKPSEELQGLRS